MLPCEVHQYCAFEQSHIIPDPVYTYNRAVAILVKGKLMMEKRAKQIMMSSETQQFYLFHSMEDIFHLSENFRIEITKITFETISPSFLTIKNIATSVLWVSSS